MKKHICLAVILILIFTSCSTEKEEPVPQSQYPEGSIFGPSGPTKIVDVTNPKTGRTWMDRNLGASQVATSSTDAVSYGDLYQWGRGSDGHQLRTSATTPTGPPTFLSSTNQPGISNFIVNSDIAPFDWRNPRNDNLWQGINGVNNPCPSGYRIPTEAEWIAEYKSWSANTSAGALASPLKLPLAGFRSFSLGSFRDVSTSGYYWSSTVFGSTSHFLVFDNSKANVSTNYRALGFSIRCIKN